MQNDRSDKILDRHLKIRLLQLKTKIIPLKSNVTITKRVDITAQTQSH